jgi:cytochrome c-type biogenesis protein CcmF
MVVHLGVIVLAVGVIAATAYRQQAELTLRHGQTVTYDGHRFEFVGLHTAVTPSKTSSEARVEVDGAVFTPAITNFGGALATVGTPAIDSGAFGDVYLTFDQVGGLGSTSGGSIVANLPAGSVVIGVVIEPLVAWLWTGGLLIGLGGLLALAPGSRRKATDPVSAPSAMASDRGVPPEREPEAEKGADEGADVDERRTDLTPVGSGVPVESGATSA